MARIIAILALVPLLGACATIVEGTSQEFIVNVSPDSAYCQLTRKGVPISSINGGKNLITLEKSRNDIIFDCTAPGYEQELIKIESSATGWGVVGCIFIDLCITDYSTGALNSYADSVNISLKRKGQGDAVLGNATLAPPLDATWRSISISSNPPQASCQLINNGRVVGYVQTPGAIQIQLPTSLWCSRLLPQFIMSTDEHVIPFPAPSRDPIQLRPEIAASIAAHGLLENPRGPRLQAGSESRSKDVTRGSCAAKAL